MTDRPKPAETSLPTAANQASRAADIAARRSEYPIAPRDEVGGLTITLDRAKRISDLGLNDDAGPDEWLPEFERADLLWSNSDTERRLAADDHVTNSLLWSTSTNLLFPKHGFWLWPTPLEDKLDIHYAAYSDTLGRPYAIKRWKADDFFASQRLSGPNPMMIRPVTSTTDLNGRGDCVIDQDHLQQRFPGMTLQSAIDERRLYICDYHLLEDLVIEEGTPTPIMIEGVPLGLSMLGGARYFYAPIALFVWTGDLRTDVGPGLFPGDDETDERVDGRLEPVAIQIRRGPDVNRDHVFQPHHQIPWLIARAVVQNADALLHEMRFHLGWTHLVMEAFAICTEHTLHDNHPIGQLLRHHFRLHLRIQAVTGDLTDSGRAMEALLSPSLEASTGLLQTACDDWDFCMHAYPGVELATRGMLDAPIRYPYRDDGMRVFRAIDRFTTAYVGEFYEDDAAIAADNELADWVAALIDPARGRVSRLLEGGITEVTTREQLAHILAGILWTTGPQHAAVNFPQWDYMCAVANMPLGIYSPAPTGPFDAIPVPPAYFPPDIPARLQASVLYVLGTWRYDGLGQYGDTVFGTSGLPESVLAFHDDLERADLLLRSIDGEREVAYPYLRRHNIPNATNV